MSQIIHYLSHLSFSALFTYIIILKSLPFLKRIFPAKPTQRGMHKIIKPSSGGISFIFTYLILVIYQGFYLPLLSFPIAVLGMIDDKYNISKILRFVFQVLTLLSIIFYIARDDSSFIGNILNVNLIYIVPLIIFGATIINSINFMDGIDGLVASCMFLIILTISIDLNLNIYFLLGALFGFIIINWNPAKVFMGDIGSNFLGYFVVVLILENNQIDKIISGFLLMSPLIMDSGICLIKRILNEENKSEIFKPHKKHLYQKMYQAGISQKKVSLMYIFTTLYLCSIYLFFYNIGILLINSLIILIGIFLLDKRYSSITNN